LSMGLGMVGVVGGLYILVHLFTRAPKTSA
jgi:hypothetical protein